MIKDVFGYEGLYFADVNGNIITNNWKNTKKTAILRPAKDKKGYLRVGLQKNGKLSSHRVHRLVALTFLPNPENKEQVNHVNGIKQDNRLENLEWCTGKENMIHAYRAGLSYKLNPVNKIPKRGVLNGNSLLNDLKVLEIREKFKQKGITRKILSKEYGVTENCIKDVVIRKSWKHI